MAVRTIRTYGDPVLRAPSKPVTDFSADFAALKQDMIDTCLAAEGLGLAAPQIGVGQRIIYVDLTPYEPTFVPLFLFNPRILDTNGRIVREEGCLSFPGLSEEVARPAFVRAQFEDESGATHTVEASGLYARCIAHEIDHLNGVLIVDHLSTVRRQLLRGSLKRIRSGETPSATADLARG